MDRIDREIIDLLRQDARLSYRELGEKVFLSANATADRVRRLISEGVLEGFAARVNLAALDLPLQALVDIKLQTNTLATHFEAVIQSIPGILSATLVTGSHDYMLRIACRDQQDFVRILDALRANAGVQDMQSRVILRDIEVHAKLGRT